MSDDRVCACSTCGRTFPGPNTLSAHLQFDQCAEGPLVVTESHLMVLKGSVMRTNEWMPNVVTIFADRIEETNPGFLKTRVNTMRFDQIAQLREKRGVAFTELTIESMGGGTIVARGLSKDHASQAKELIDRLIAAARTAGAAPAPAGPDVADQIRSLAQLRDEGLLTEADFEARKAQILDRL